jgi:hypothetical protein
MLFGPATIAIHNDGDMGGQPGFIKIFGAV